MKLYPPSKRDRLALGLCVLSAVIFLGLLQTADDVVGHVLLVLTGCSAVFLAASAYLFQDPHGAASTTYEVVFGRLDDTRSVLAGVSAFIEHERRRVAETQQKVTTLRKEQIELELILTPRRASVHAILDAHATRQQRRIWKERLIAFILGVLSSSVVTLLDERAKAFFAALNAAGP